MVLNGQLVIIYHMSIAQIVKEVRLARVMICDCLKYFCHSGRFCVRCKMMLLIIMFHQFNAVLKLILQSLKSVG